jgi:nucleobase:cation symporter-1, NCS1 family
MTGIHTAVGGEIAGARIESRSYEYVPICERHGRTRDLFTLWFGEQLSSFALVTGVLAVTMGLNFWWSMVAIIAGNLIGALMMAGHSAQGPAVGLPQMVQSRAQFGFYGNLLPLIITWFMYVAFSAVAVVIAGQSFQSVFGGPLPGWIALSVVPIAVLAIIGHDLIHRSLKYVGCLMGLLFSIVAGMLIHHGITIEQLGTGEFTWAAFLGAVSIYVTWQMTYAPYVSDYSRYLPASQARGAFWHTYIGTTLGSILVMVLGAAIARLAPADDIAHAVRSLGGGIGGAIIVIALALGLIVVNSTNLYGGIISTLTMVQHFKDFTSTATKRVAVAALVAILAVAVGVAGSGNFVANLTDYLNFALFFLIPWTSINLLDFYVIHHGNYAAEDFFSKHATFGKWGLACHHHLLGCLRRGAAFHAHQYLRRPDRSDHGWLRPGLAGRVVGVRPDVSLFGQAQAEAATPGSGPALQHGRPRRNRRTTRRRVTLKRVALLGTSGGNLR